ncbi:hypothetical protein MBLNU457_6643t2 [Dothideomycetes sp. NU457]
MARNEGGPTSSLDRLKVLDKTFDTLEQRIDEAARILNIRLEHGQHPALVAAGHKQRLDLPSYGRHEFVLRWILEKLKTQPEARSTVAAWSLAWHVVQDMSLASCVRTLGPSGVMSSVRDALIERFPSENSSFSTTSVLQDGQESGKVSKKSKKRKSTSDTNTPGDSDDMDTHIRLFANIAMLVQVMVSKSGYLQTGQDTVLKHQMHAALRLDGEVRTQMMKHWLLALVCIIGRPKNKHLSSSAFLSSNTFLLLDVWNLQALPTSAERDASVQSFCTECGWPLFLLLSYLRMETESRDSSDAVSPKLKEAIEGLQRLFAAQVLMPARRAVLEPTSEAAQTTPSEKSPRLLDFIRPICEKVEALKQSKDSDVDGQSQLQVAQLGLSGMVDVAVRSIRFNTPKRKQHEMPWINSLIMALQCLTSQDASTTVRGRHFVTNSSLAGMLSILLERKLSLSAETLTFIIEHHCHLPSADSSQPQHSLDTPQAGGDSPPDFALLAKIIAMDAGPFTRDSKGENSLAERTFRALAIYASFSDLDPLSLIKSTDVQAMIKLWRNSIAIPLMHAFARSRSLLQYLSLWHAFIPRLGDEKTYKEWSLLADEHLQSALQETLEQSLTFDQITQVLKELSDNQSGSCKEIRRPDASKGKRESTQPTGCEHDSCWPLAVRTDQDKVFATEKSPGSGLIILNAILGAIHSDDLIKQLSEPFRCLIEHVSGDIVSGTYNDKTKKPSDQADKIFEDVYQHGWACLIRLNELWLPVAAAEIYPVRGSSMNNDVKPAVVFDQGKKLTNLATAEAAFSTISKSNARMTSNDPSVKLRVEGRLAIALEYLIQFVAMRNRMPELESVSKWILRELCHTDVEYLRGAKFDAHIEESIIDFAFGARSVAASYPQILSKVIKRYPQVWPLLSHDKRSGMLSRLVSSENQSTDFGMNELISSICDSSSKTTGSQSSRTATIQDELFESLLSIAENHSNQDWLADILINVWPELLLSLQQRQHVIDWAIAKLAKGKHDESEDKTGHLKTAVLLAIMVKMSGQAFGTPTDLADGDRFWKLTDRIQYDEKTDIQALFSRFCSNVFDVVGKWLEDTKATLLETLSKRLVKELKKTKSRAMTPSKMLLASHVIAFADSKQFSTLELPHTDPEVVESFSKQLIEGEQNSTISSQILQIVPQSYWQKGSSSIGKALESTMAQASEVHAASDVSKSSEVVQHDADSLSWALSVGDLGSREALQLVRSLVNLLSQHHLSPTTYAIVYDAFEKSCNEYMGDKMVLIDELMGLDMQIQPQALALVNVLINSLNRSQLDASGSLGPATRLVSSLTARLAQESRTRMHSGLTNCITTILRSKPFLISQHNLESLLACIHKLLTPASPALSGKAASAIYTNICTLMQAILQFHRSSLGGRIHLITPVLIQLTSCLFIPHKGNKNQSIFRHPPWLSADRPLMPIHASRFARVLTLLCNPPQSTISRRRSGLIDETRKVRLYVGQHIQYVLHAFVRMLLHGRLGDGVRDKLTPGLWAIIDVMDMSGSEESRIKVLGASMNKAELALLRREYEAWKAGGSWKG